MSMISNKAKFIRSLMEAKRKYDTTVNPHLVSTRLPGSVDPHSLTGEKKLNIGMESMTDPEQVEKIGNKLTVINTEKQREKAAEKGKAPPRMMPNIGLDMLRKHRTPRGIIDALGSQIERNLEFGMDRAMSLPELADRSQHWYVGARDISQKIGSAYGIPHEKMAGVVATQSPQKDWYMNASLAERIAKIHTQHKSTRWSKEMQIAARKKRGEDKNPVFNPDDEEHQKLYKAIRGKSYGELTDPMHQAAWIRTFDEAHHPRRYRILTPEGEMGGFAKNKDGRESDISWGDFGSIAKAVRILDSEGTPESISPHLGQEHKVRSFYNNILQPNAPRKVSDVTVDTHAIGSALGRYNISTATPDLSQFMGGAASVETGQRGLYPLVKDKFEKLAGERGIIGNAAQSIIWDTKRADSTTEGQDKEINQTWEQFRAGAIPHKKVLSSLSAILGPAKPASWMKVKPTKFTSTFESAKYKLTSTARYLKEIIDKCKTKKYDI